MAYVIAPRVAETSASTGTGALTLAGALTAYQSFGSVCAVNDTLHYVIVASDGTWETGYGTYSAANTLTRTVVTNSSNANAAVAFAAGTKTVFLHFPGAAEAILRAVSKTTIADADKLALMDSAASNALKSLAISDLKTALTANPVNVASVNGGSLAGLRNRIINGDMRIDQRNNGASTTPAGSAYVIDRWLANITVASKITCGRNLGAAAPPSGFNYYLGVQTATAYAVAATDSLPIMQAIEGFNASDLQWGTVNAQTVTLSFWVQSSITGTHGGSVRNGATNRSYVFSYQINVANTWTYVTATIPGDTTGTWTTDATGGIWVAFSMGAGTSASGTAGSWQAASYAGVTGGVSVVGTLGATWRVTGVQLEAGSVATAFERRSYALEMLLCQRYFEAVESNSGGALNPSTTAGNMVVNVYWRAQKRTTPTVTTATGTVQEGNPALAMIYGSAASGGWFFPGRVTANAEL